MIKSVHFLMFFWRVDCIFFYIFVPIPYVQASASLLNLTSISREKRWDIVLALAACLIFCPYLRSYISVLAYELV